jgi:cytochrome c
MKTLRLALFSALALLFILSAGLAMKDEAVEQGKAHFNDPKFAGGTAEKSCATCHPDGGGMDKAAAKKEWKDSEGNVKTLEDMVNMCIVGALEGKAIDKDSEEMKDVVAYIKSFKKEAKMEKEVEKEMEEEIEKEKPKE